MTTPGQQVIQLATACNATTVSNGARHDSNYTRAWRLFVECVDREHSNGVLLPGDKYLTRENVDFFLATEVTKMMNFVQNQQAGLPTGCRSMETYWSIQHLQIL